MNPERPRTSCTSPQALSHRNGAFDWFEKEIKYPDETARRARPRISDSITYSAHAVASVPDFLLLLPTRRLSSSSPLVTTPPPPVSCFPQLIIMKPPTAAAVEIFKLIEAERAYAVAEAHTQCNAFRETAIRMNGELDTQVRQTSLELDRLVQALCAAGIRYEDGRFSFSSAWGEAVPGLKRAASRFFAPCEVLSVLQGAKKSPREGADHGNYGADAMEEDDSEAECARPLKRFKSEPAILRTRGHISKVGNSVIQMSPVCVSGPPVLDRWSPVITSAPSLSEPTLLPPVSIFEGAHGCSYYIWFALRFSFLHKLRCGASLDCFSPLSPAAWQAALKTCPAAAAEEGFKPHMFDLGSQSPCACGMPPLQPVIVASLPKRADGSAFSAVDFADRAFQQLLLVDLELGHMQIQLEQTDAMLCVSSPPASPSSPLWQSPGDPDAARTRVKERRAIFRSMTFGSSFAEESFEMAERRDWVLRFAKVVKNWPGSPLVSSRPRGQALSQDMPVVDSPSVGEAKKKRKLKRILSSASDVSQTAVGIGATASSALPPLQCALAGVAGVIDRVTSVKKDARDVAARLAQTESLIDQTAFLDPSRQALYCAQLPALAENRRLLRRVADSSGFDRTVHLNDFEKTIKDGNEQLRDAQSIFLMLLGLGTLSGSCEIKEERTQLNHHLSEVMNTLAQSNQILTQTNQRLVESDRAKDGEILRLAYQRNCAVVFLGRP
ncbi:unnamed protein product [Mycena citricolor]|uniref:Uncharacterized protein n=1 Tax=Mycena citricolor TaxID=2018698 RepID=A0AAD2HFQ4_9AGAR|nr:unnamed protein product [Mycena citricolor]CAK5276524.1 unnamed protein product [Mycena citricolor]